MQEVPVAETVTHAQQNELLERILASTSFRKSRRLSDFLSFVCTRYQAGDLAAIQEHRIGVEVFGRQEGYHVGEDSIVRSQARILRQRLEEYFAGEGLNETLILSIPKGSYIPRFYPRELPEKPAKAAPTYAEPAAAQIPPQGVSQNRWIVWSVGILVILLAVGLAVHHFSTAADAASPSTLEAKFWTTVFDPSREQMIVPSDSSLVLMEQLSGTRVPLDDYMSRKYLTSPPPAGLDLPYQIAKNSQYTSLADLNLVFRLQRLPALQTGKVQIRYARDLSLKELKQANALLIGGVRANPWTELFDNSVGFRVDYDPVTQRNVVLNRKVLPGEKDRYTDEMDNGRHVAYGVISFVPSLDGRGSALLIRGTKKAGTEAAGDFLFTAAFQKILKSVDSPHGPQHFELLLSTGEINGDAHHTQVVSFHTLD